MNGEIPMGQCTRAAAFLFLMLSLTHHLSPPSSHIAPLMCEPFTDS